jgi:ABC-type multidrug transport system ATPase subunit
MKELYVDSVEKSFFERQVLSDIYLTCSPGEILGLLGRNGSGKSTLLQIIFGSLNANHKFVRVDGQVLTTFSQSKGRICYLPQGHFLPSHLTIERSIELFCDKRLIDDVKRLKPVNNLLDRKPGNLSGGQLRLIEVLLVLNSGCPYLLLDEPFIGTSPIEKDKIKNLIKDCSASTGLIMTDHDYHSILDVATRVVVLLDGRVREVKNEDDLVSLEYLPKTKE